MRQYQYPSFSATVALAMQDTVVRYFQCFRLMIQKVSLRDDPHSCFEFTQQLA